MTATRLPASSLTRQLFRFDRRGNHSPSHGPAEPTIAPACKSSFLMRPQSPFEGEATLTDAQASDLMAGKWYFNVHTAANKGGEIRGQVTK